MLLDVYIGTLDDSSFSYEGGNWSGNIPKKISSWFPEGHKAFRLYLEKIKNNEFVGKQVDWGGWAAFVTPDIICLFLNELPASEKRSQLLRFAKEQLNQQKEYVLVGIES
ncbi:hypothetical protein [Thalassobacillus sp. C254]|uniref:hypothetical protein n=1 Tax=Thalassobacillus sp. C254 TaxID=1225341 RepID=UPI0006CF2AFD|nr:hypothetical protein [Thalassobacillus sp. C254]